MMIKRGLRRVIKGLEWSLDTIESYLLIVARRLSFTFNQVPEVGSVWVYHPYLKEYKDYKNYLVDIIDSNEDYVFYSSYYGNQHQMETPTFRILYKKIRNYQDE